MKWLIEVKFIIIYGICCCWHNSCDRVSCARWDCLRLFSSFHWSCQNSKTLNFGLRRDTKPTNAPCEQLIVSRIGVSVRTKICCKLKTNQTADSSELSVDVLMDNDVERRSTFVTRAILFFHCEHFNPVVTMEYRSKMVLLIEQFYGKWHFGAVLHEIVNFVGVAAVRTTVKQLTTGWQTKGRAKVQIKLDYVKKEKNEIARNSIYSTPSRSAKGRKLHTSPGSNEETKRRKKWFRMRQAIYLYATLIHSFNLMRQYDDGNTDDECILKQLNRIRRTQSKYYSAFHEYKWRKRQFCCFFSLCAVCRSSVFEQNLNTMANKWQ